MNPYHVMGINPEGMNPEQFRNALFQSYRKGAQTKHPDKGGSNEEWLEFQLAHDVLRDPARRKRFDETGSVNETKATPAKVRNFIRLTMNAVVEAQTESGRTDDPTMENICQKIMGSMRNARRQLDDRIITTQAKLTRAKELKSRFILSQEGVEDIVRILLDAEIDRINADLAELDDAKVINVEALDIFSKYGYKVGRAPEGQFNAHPTTPNRGPDSFGGMSRDEIREAILKGDVSPNDIRRGTFRTRPNSFILDYGS